MPIIPKDSLLGSDRGIQEQLANLRVWRLETLAITSKHTMVTLMAFVIVLLALHTVLHIPQFLQYCTAFVSTITLVILLA